MNWRVPAEAGPVCEHKIRISRRAGEKAFANDMLEDEGDGCNSKSPNKKPSDKIRKEDKHLLQIRLLSSLLFSFRN